MQVGGVIDVTSDQHFMGEALRQAKRAYRLGEVPIGAVMVRGGQVIARAFNQVETLTDGTAHAEMLVLSQAQAAMADWRLADCDLYVTKEPCVMCAGALVLCRVRRVVIGVSDPRGGAAGGCWNLLQTDNLNHRCEVVSGVREDECRQVLKDFFRQARAGLIPKAGGSKVDPPLSGVN